MLKAFTESMCLPPKKTFKIESSDTLKRKCWRNKLSNNWSLKAIAITRVYFRTNDKRQSCLKYRVKPKHAGSLLDFETSTTATNYLLSFLSDFRFLFLKESTFEAQVLE